MTEQVGPLLGPGDQAPDFDLPAADRDVRIALSDCDILNDLPRPESLLALM